MTQGGVPVDPYEELFGESAGEGERVTTYRGRCTRCGLDWQRRLDVIVPTLDTLASHGVTSITLRALAGTVS